MSAVTIKAGRDFTFSEIETAWQTLEKKASDASLFVRWYWIGAWLKQQDISKVTWYRCYVEERLVGSGLFVHSPSNAGPIPIQRMLLHKSGEQKLDQIWIEHNGLLINPKYKEQVLDATLNWMSKQPFDEWVVAITEHSEDWSKPSLFNKEDGVHKSYRYRLNESHADPENIVKERSSNTRSAIRRSQRFIEDRYGSISLNFFKDDEAFSVFSELAELHRLRWNHDPQGSGFDNPKFVEFHKHLLNTPCSSCHAEVIAFYAGETCLGYTYNLIFGTNVYFYLSGVNYLNKDNRFKPGLIMHILAMAHYASKGIALYDMMGGDSQYKRSIANEAYELHYVTLRPFSRKNKFLSWLKHTKTKLKRVPS